MRANATPKCSKTMHKNATTKRVPALALCLGLPDVLSLVLFLADGQRVLGPVIVCPCAFVCVRARLRGKQRASFQTLLDRNDDVRWCVHVCHGLRACIREKERKSLRFFQDASTYHYRSSKTRTRLILILWISLCHTVFISQQITANHSKDHSKSQLTYNRA